MQVGGETVVHANIPMVMAILQPWFHWRGWHLGTVRIRPSEVRPTPDLLAAGYVERNRPAWFAVWVVSEVTPHVVESARYFRSGAVVRGYAHIPGDVQRMAIIGALRWRDEGFAQVRAAGVIPWTVADVDLDVLYHLIAGETG